MFQLYKVDNRVMAIIDADSSVEVGMHGAKFSGTLNGQPISGGGSAEWVKQYAVDGAPGTRELLADVPSQLAEVIVFVPGAGSKGALTIKCSGTRDSGDDASVSLAPFIVKGSNLSFDLKGTTSPVRIEIWKAVP